MSFFIILLCGVLSCMKVTMQGQLSRKSIKNTNDSIAANCLIFAFTAVLFSISVKSGININVVSYSLLFGICSASFQIFYALSLKSGPFSISCMLINLSMVLPAIFSIIVFGEKLTLMKFIGMILCILALFLNIKSDNKKMNLKWFLYVALAFLSTGSLAIVQKVFAKSSFGEELSQFIFLGYFIAFLITFIVVLILKGQKQEINFKINKQNIMFILVIVVCLGAYQYFSTLANSFIDAIILSPSISGLSTMFLTLSGRIFFKEHFTSKQILSICCGFIAILLISF